MMVFNGAKIAISFYPAKFCLLFLSKFLCSFFHTLAHYYYFCGTFL